MPSSSSAAQRSLQQRRPMSTGTGYFEVTPLVHMQCACTFGSLGRQQLSRNIQCHGRVRLASVCCGVVPPAHEKGSSGRSKGQLRSSAVSGGHQLSLQLTDRTCGGIVTHWLANAEDSPGSRLRLQPSAHAATVPILTHAAAKPDSAGCVMGRSINLQRCEARLAVFARLCNSLERAQQTWQYSGLQA